jgi:probable HAF family extracellular repeat protein
MPFLMRGLLLIVLVSTVSIARAQYRAYDLGTLGGASAACGINSAGTITGWSYTTGGSEHAFSYSAGVMTDLGALGGTYSSGVGINNAGTVAGSIYLNTWHAFSYSGGTITDLETLGGTYSYAFAINNAGTIVGQSANSQGQYHAFSYKNGVMTDLGTLDGSYSEALAVNDAGTIVGYSYLSNTLNHAFSYSGGVMTDLGTLDTSGGPAGSSEAFGINASGTIIGYSSTADGHTHAFSYSAGIMSDLGSATGGNSGAYGINSAGVIVGEMSTSDFSAWLAFVYGDGVTTDLSPFLDNIGLTGNTRATAIADNGDIVGYGTTAGGQTRAFLLITVPEPSTSALLALAAAGFIFSLRRQCHISPRRSGRG